MQRKGHGRRNGIHEEAVYPSLRLIKIGDTEQSPAGDVLKAAPEE